MNKKLEQLKSGVEFTSILLACFKLNGRKPETWRKIGLNPSREDDLFDPGYMNLFRNPLAEDVSQKEMIFGQVMAALRHKYVDDVLLEQVKNNAVRQIVILGAGFDPRAQKYNFEDVKYYEVDSNKVLDLKEEIYSEENVPLNAQYIKIDYIKEDLLAHLLDAGASLKEKTLFIWEGNSMYSSRDEVNNLWHKIHEAFNDYVLVMDYFSKKFVEKSTGVEELDRVINDLAKLNVKFINGYDDIEEFCKDTHLKLMENLSAEEFARRQKIHDGERPDMRHWSFCHLSKN